MPIKITPNVNRFPDRRPRLTGEPIPVPQVWHLAEGDELPGRVWFRLQRDRDEQWVCTELSIDSDRPLTSTVLRRIPLSRIIEDLLNQQLDYLDRGGPLNLDTGLRDFYDDGPIGAGGTFPETSLTRAEIKDLYLANSARAPTKARPLRGGKGPDEGELQQFATAYKRALQTDRLHAISKAMQYLAQDKDRPLFITRATANRWRDKCRALVPPLLEPK